MASTITRSGLDHLKCRGAGHSFGFGIVKKLFAALPEEGKGKTEPGRFERWVRRRARSYLGRCD